MPEEPQDMELERRSESSLQRAGDDNTLMSTLARIIRDPDTDVARFREAVEVCKDLENLQAKREFNMALARIRPQLPIIPKGGKVDYQSEGKPRVRYDFARFEHMQQCLQPILSAEGFSVSFSSEFVAVGNSYQEIYVGTLSHRLGHFKEAKLALPADVSGGKNALQAKGSSMSYAFRYLYRMLLDLVVMGADDDGMKRSAITEQQTNNILDLMTECGMDAASQSKFLEIMQVKALGDLKQSQYPDAMYQLKRKLAQVRK